MTQPSPPPAYTVELSRDGTGSVTAQLAGRIDTENAAAVLARLAPAADDAATKSITVDLERVDYLDDYGVLVLVELKKKLGLRKAELSICNMSGPAKAMVELFRLDSAAAPLALARSPGAIERLGAAALEQAADLKHMISFIGAVCLALARVVRKPTSLRADDTFLCMQKTGVDALPIVALISFLLGLIMAFMSAVQLRQFGANIYVASLVSLSMARELGPIMTAIIVAGRSGSAFAAEIGTMKISEEVDALVTMGFEPVRFLVMPKMVASVIVVPFLVLFSDVCAIAGGLIVGVGMLDLTAGAYIDQTVKTLTLFDVFLGFGKSAFFALLISWVGCFRGFQVSGGAASVGHATTSAVVSSIFLIIVSDALFAVILRYWG
jgi:phospholipid/cholesterol/gamma-HCH transport system permease protein